MASRWLRYYLLVEGEELAISEGAMVTTIDVDVKDRVHALDVHCF